MRAKRKLQQNTGVNLNHPPFSQSYDMLFVWYDVNENITSPVTSYVLVLTYELLQRGSKNGDADISLEMGAE